MRRIRDEIASSTSFFGFDECYGFFQIMEMVGIVLAMSTLI